MASKSNLSSGGAAEFSRFRSRNDQRKMILKVIVWLVALVLLTGTAAIACKLFFSVETIVVDGTGHYSFSEITEACGLEKGQIIFGISEKKMNQILTERFSFVRSITVEKQYPSTVVITVEEEEPEFYFEMKGEYYLITRSLKVLEYFEYEEKLNTRYPDAMRISLPVVSKAVVSDVLEFESAAKSRHTDEVLTMLAGSRLFDGLTQINLSDRFDICIEFEDRIVIHMGSATDFEEKLDLVLGMIHAYSDEATGTLYAENVQQGIAQIKDPAKE